jgi:hypothetical protein
MSNSNESIFLFVKRRGLNKTQGEEDDNESEKKVKLPHRFLADGVFVSRTSRKE